jgi:Recombination endonuclease VII
MTPTKLKTTGVKPTRKLLLEQQGFKCAICDQPLAEDKAVLDHDHKGGHIRAVLHRDCNIMLGKVENASVRTGMGRERMIQFLQGAGQYIVTHQKNVTGLIHPSHFTAEEKIERRKAKGKRTRAKAKAAKLT